MGSDGGGETLPGLSPLQGEYWWLPVFISGLALLVSIGWPAVNLLLSRRAARRQAVRDALSSLLTPEVVRARVVLAKVAQREVEFYHPSYIDATDEQQAASNKEFDGLIDGVRDASFTVMWAIQALVPMLRPYVELQIHVSVKWPQVSIRRSVGVPEAETVLAHVELMSADLATALEDWGTFAWHTQGKMTNQALLKLPKMLGHSEREAAQLDLPPTEEEVARARRDQVKEELKQSRMLREQREAEKAKQAAGTEDWKLYSARWKPKVKPPSEVQSERGGSHRDS